jgi:hypothetical protein
VAFDEPVSYRIQHFGIIIRPEVVELDNLPVELLLTVLGCLFASVAIKNPKIAEQDIGLGQLLRVVYGLIVLVLVVTVERGLALKANFVAVFHVFSMSLYRVGSHSHIHDHIFFRLLGFATRLAVIRVLLFEVATR